MTRFVVCTDNLYVTAVYDRTSNGIGLTPNREDAGSWVTYERAFEVARIVAQCLGTFASVHSVTEPHYPKSWALAAD